MNYSIKPMLHHAPTKDGLQKIQILIIYNRAKFTLPTHFRVAKENFVDARVTGIANAKLINLNILNLIRKYETILLNAINNSTTDNLKQLFSGQTPTDVKTFNDYAAEVVKRLNGKLTVGRLRHYNTLAKYVKEFGGIRLREVSPKVLTKFEKYLRETGLQNNTVHSKMKMMLAILHRGIVDKVVERDSLDGYKIIPYVQPIPDYLTEEEIDIFKSVVDAARPERYKIAGYYFLLSCYAGFRISDLSSFNYKNSVKENRIIIRAAKNKQPVLIPLYPKLAEVLEKIKDLPFTFTEQSMRKYVKELATLAGLTRNIKVHTARHTFAMMCMENGFEQDDVAALLGDSPDVARIYARVTNKRLERKIMEKFGTHQ